MNGELIVVEPLVSIIIPVFNVAPYLEEALNSVICQTYHNLEIIVVDDGSNDGSERISDKYADLDSRIRVIHQKNRGLSGARNQGLDIITGEVVSFLDSDDSFHPDMIRRMVEVMLSEQAEIVMCRYRNYKTEKTMKHLSCQKQKPIVYDKRMALRALFEGRLDSRAWNKIYRKNLFNTIRYPLGHVYEDADTTYKLIEKCNHVAVIDEELVAYRIREESITGYYSEAKGRDRELAYNHLSEFVSQNMGIYFSEEHRQFIDRLLISAKLTNWARYQRYDSTCRKMILNMSKRLNLRNCSLGLKWKLFFLRMFPHTFRVVHRINDRRLGVHIKKL